MLTSIILGLAMILNPASALAPQASAPATIEQPYILDLSITTSNDEAQEREAWAALDALTEAEHDEYALGGMRVTYIGTTEAGFATQTMFTIETPDTTHVFSKTVNEGYADVRMDSLSPDEQANLTQNLPDCDEDIVKACINHDVTTITF